MFFIGSVTIVKCWKIYKDQQTTIHLLNCLMGLIEGGQWTGARTSLTNAFGFLCTPDDSDDSWLNANANK